MIAKPQAVEAPAQPMVAEVPPQPPAPPAVDSPPPTIELPSAPLLAAETIAAELLAEPQATPVAVELPPAPSFVAEPAQACSEPATLPSPPPTAELPPAMAPVFVPQPSVEPPPPASAELSPQPAIEETLPSLDELLAQPILDLPPPTPEYLPAPVAESPSPAESELPPSGEPQADYASMAPAIRTLVPCAAPTAELLPPPPEDGEAPPDAADRPWHDGRSTSGEHRREPSTHFVGTPHFAGAPPPVELEPDIDEAITLRRSLSAEFFSWLHNRLPGRPAHRPADAMEPSWAEKRMARQVAVAVAGAAVLSLLPVLVLCHANLPAAPPWALWATFVAVVQLVFAGWMVNAPDWVTARVQMMVSAATTTIYAMVMTLLVITPERRQLALGLDELRNMNLAPAWCGLICLVMALVTWFCGYTAAKWRREAEQDGPR
jgi:hypothetical protein